MHRESSCLDHRALVVTVGKAVAVDVEIGHAAAAITFLDLVGVIRTGIQAVGGPVGIGIGIRNATPTLTRFDLVDIDGTSIDAIRGAV